jgi:hypothetical protein
MRALSSPVLAALAAGEVALVQLVHLAFSSGVVALNSSNWNLVWSGVTYQGAYGLGSVSVIDDSAGEVKGISLQLDAGNPSIVALALDDADVVQGAVVTIRTAIIETTNYTILDAPIEWLGRCDTMSIGEDGKQASINVKAESGAVDLLRGNQTTYSDGDQQAAYVGDLAFAYVVSQVDKPIVWPAREYFFK